MKDKIITELRNITRHALSQTEYEAVADVIIKIVQDHNRTAAIVAVEAVKKVLTDGDDAARKAEGEKDVHK